MGVIAKLGRVTDSISSRYIGFWPCFQASPDSLTTLIDRSGKGNHGVAGASGIGGAAFGTPLMFTSNTAANTGALLAKAALAGFLFNASRRDSLVWSARVQTPNSVSSDTIMRTGTSASTGGWWLETNSTGASGSAPGVRLKLYDTVLGAISPMGYAALPANTETTVGFIIDGPGNQFFLAINGVLAAVSTGTNPASAAGATTGIDVQASALDAYFGGASQGGSDVKKLRGVHIAVVPSSAGAIADPAALLMRLHQFPYTALAASELP